jgi:proteasome accessory factor C
VTTSTDQIERLLALVPYLQHKGEVSVAEAADRFGVSERVIERDLSVLMMCGLPGLLPGEIIDFDFQALEDDRVIRIRDADFLARPLRLGNLEAVALVAALRALREGSGDAEREVVDRTLAKISDAVGGVAEAVRVQPLVSEAERDLADRLGEAVRDRRQVRLRHASAVRDEVTTRVVDPVAVSAAEGHLYLDGWDHRSGEQRLFRLDRIVGLDVLETTVETDAAAQDLSRGAFRPDETAPRAVVRVAASAAWVGEYYPVEHAAPVTDGPFAGGLDLTLPLGDADWLVGLLLGIGGEAVVIDPPELATRVREAARRALAAYT